MSDELPLRNFFLVHIEEPPDDDPTCTQHSFDVHFVGKAVTKKALLDDYELAEWSRPEEGDLLLEEASVVDLIQEFEKARKVAASGTRIVPLTVTFSMKVELPNTMEMAQVLEVMLGTLDARLYGTKYHDVVRESWNYDDPNAPKKPS
jgi:hypothetical protein